MSRGKQAGITIIPVTDKEKGNNYTPTEAVLSTSAVR